MHVGIGDDGAVLRTSMMTVAACDPVIEGVHFTREEPLHLVGRKAVNRNLSDLAAMGSRPSFLLVSMVLPNWMNETSRRKLLSGIQQAADNGGCSVVGGDLARVGGDAPLVVTVTALGEAPRRPLRRCGLEVGDSLHVTGPLGGSRLGRHLRFTPRIAEGIWLAELRQVTATIDISDSLLVDLSRMLEASSERVGVELGAELFAANLPIATAAHRAAEASRRTPLQHALEDGEDHELLFGLRKPLPVDGPLTGRSRKPIGCITETPGIILIDRSGGRRELQVAGYEHDV